MVIEGERFRKVGRWLLKGRELESGEMVIEGGRTRKLERWLLKGRELGKWGDGY